MTTRYAIIGNGGREHALSMALAKSVGQENVLTLCGNAGIKNSHKVDFLDFEALQLFCRQQQISTIVAGSEAALVKGLFDFFVGSDIRVFGASRAAAQLEGSKIFSKRFMAQYGVKTADFRDCQSIADADEFVRTRSGNVVIKYDGLAAGKGVYVCDNIEECAAAFAELQDAHGQNFPFIVEEKLIGDEVSIIAFTDGKNLQLLLPAQDHKQIFDGDKGANTGGMGAYCPVPWCNADIMSQIRADVMAPTMRGIMSEGFDYKGIIYFGLMITADGAYNLEYNVRLGDPEAQVLLPSLRTPLADVISACLDGTLGDLQLQYESNYFVDVVKTAEGYPARPKTGETIRQIVPFAPDTLLFYSGVQLAAGSNTDFLTAGGRVLNVVAHAPTLSEAIAKAYTEVAKIDFSGSHFRRDIGSRKRRVLPQLAVFISGRGSNMQAIWAATQSGGALNGIAKIGFVFSNNIDAEGLTWAAQKGIATYCLAAETGEKRKAYDARVKNLLQTLRFDYIILAGYMRVLSADFVQSYAGKIINIHPADTRQHQGLHAYDWAWSQRLGETFITVHKVDEGMDTGEILAQYPVDLRACQNLAEVEQRGLAVEHKAYSATIARLLSFDVDKY
jgi:phosphoribosylamine---glycine ligase